MQLEEKFLDPEAVFSQTELYQAVELIAPQLGFERPGIDPLPPQAIAKTTALTIPGYEHIGVMLVRERTVQDVQVNVPSLMDKLLGNNLAPSLATYSSVARIALAKIVIVSPVNLVQQILDSTDARNMKFFLDFDVEYGKWMKALADEIAKKNSGMTNGNALNSSSETEETSSQPIQVG